MKHDVDGAAAGEAAEVDAQQAREAGGRQAHGMKRVGQRMEYYYYSPFIWAFFLYDCVS